MKVCYVNIPLLLVYIIYLVIFTQHQFISVSLLGYHARMRKWESRYPSGVGSRTTSEEHTK